MFYNLRYYSAIVLVVFICLVGMFAFYANGYSQKHIIRDMSAQYASTHTQYFQNAVWERYFPIINFVAKDDKRDPSIIPSYMIFEKEMDALFAKPEVVAAEFFNNGNMLYSSRNTKAPLDEIDIVDATSSPKVVGKIIKKALPEGGKKLYLYRSIYYPLLTDLPDIYKQFTENLNTQLIVYYDVDSKVRRFSVIIYMVCALFVFAAIGAFAYMYFYSFRVEKMIEKGGLSIDTSASTKAGGGTVVQTQFFANLNHELRTPLNSIIGFSELIKNESMGPIENTKYKEFVNNIYESGRRLLALIDDAQDFTKSVENKLELKAQEMDLTKITKLCLKMSETQIQQKALELDDQIPKSHYIISADPNRIKQVISTILENAIRFNAEGGKITVRYIIDGEPSDKGSKITLEIKDTGLGMNPEDLSNVMIPFGKAEENEDALSETATQLVENEDEQGSELSMPLTKQLVEQMGGKFDITSELNLGTTVRITFLLVGSVDV